MTSYRSPTEGLKSTFPGEITTKTGTGSNEQEGPRSVPIRKMPLDRLSEEELAAKYNIKPQIGDYRLISTLSYVRGQREVFLGERINAEEKVVLKRSQNGRYRRDKELQAILKGYGEHKNLLLAEDFIDEENIMVYRYISGGDLKSLEKMGPFTPQQIKNLFLGLCRATEYMHHCGVTHHDLKNSNIFLDTEPGLEIIQPKDLQSLERITPKIGDFELGWHRKVTDLALRPGQLAGTLPYMAPEMIKRGVRNNPLNDVYALAVIAFRLLTRAFPYSAAEGTTEQEQIAEIMEQHENGKIPSLIERNSEVSADLEEVIQKGLALDPKNRWLSPMKFGLHFAFTFR